MAIRGPGHRWLSLAIAAWDAWTNIGDRALRETAVRLGVSVVAHIRTALGLVASMTFVTGTASAAEKSDASAARDVAPQAAAQPTTVRTKDGHAIQLSNRREDVIYIKFRDDLSVRLREGALTDFGTGAIAEAAAVIAKHAAAKDAWSRVHDVAEDVLDGFRATASKSLGRATADHNTEYHLTLAVAGEIARDQALADFNVLGCVEVALGVPVPVAAPLPPNLQNNQGYLNPSTTGVGATQVWPWPGGTGGNCRVVDLEYSWNLNHVDLPTVTRIGPAGVDPFNDTNHGTAVLGQVVSRNNGWGTTGICYDATAHVVPTFRNNNWNVGGAITTAMTVLSAGDVIIIEQQTDGPLYDGSSQFGLVPVEWYFPWYQSIVTAVGNGVTIAEAAGNGSQNLDAAMYSSGNGGHWPFLLANDSGAIIIGAGCNPGGSSTDRSRLWFSNYGATVDLQGWGENVFTCGYGDRFSAEGLNSYYTSSFGGTSSASPIVAGACVLVQSVCKEALGVPLAPGLLKTLLRNTGAVQLSGTYPATQNIGPRPSARAALFSHFGAADCNTNQIPDAVEIGAGTSLDINGDGIPDECQPDLCIADFDESGSVAVPDIFSYLAAWFAYDPRANVDGLPGVDIPDIFAFLSMWFAGCD